MQQSVAGSTGKSLLQRDGNFGRDWRRIFLVLQQNVGTRREDRGNTPIRPARNRRIGIRCRRHPRVSRCAREIFHDWKDECSWMKCTLGIIRWRKRSR